MRWAAIILAVANAFIWFWAASGERAAQSESQGQLPRVASLKPDVVAEGESQCLRVGWFDSHEQAKGQGIELSRPYRVEQIEKAQSPLNWVLIVPQPERQALEQLRFLREQGVEAWMVTEGPNKNGISLGLFESEQAAEAVVRQKKQENLDVMLAKFPRNRLGYALVFEVEPKAKSPQVQTVEAEFGKKFEFVEVVACKGLASSKKTP